MGGGKGVERRERGLGGGKILGKKGEELKKGKKGGKGKARKVGEGRGGDKG